MVLSRHILKLITTRLVLCCDRGKIVTTSNVMFKFTFVVTMRNIVAIETFLAIFESKVDYVATERSYVATERRYVTTQKFDAQVNLCLDIQKYCCDNVSL